MQLLQRSSRSRRGSGSAGALVLAVLCGCGAVPANASAASFTLDESLAAHATLNLEAKDLIATPAGRYVAWLDGAGLFVAAGPAFEPRLLVAADAALPLTAAYPSTDGRSLFYARGTVKPAFGPYAAVDRREFWRVAVQGGTPELLAQGSDVPVGEPVFAPDGQSFVAVQGPMLFEYRVVAGALQRKPVLRDDPEHYAALRLSNVTYSPDGSKLAFVSWRKAGQSYVAVHDFTTGRHRYLEPGIFRDLTPAWSPDGRQLVFVRMPGNWTREYRFTRRDVGAPWALLVADAVSGKTRRIWQADPGPGSVFWPFGSGAGMEPSLAAAQLLWTRSGQILFPWEKTGWLSLYSVPAAGGEARALMAGAGEVALPVLDSDGRSVIVAANVGDVSRLHLWRVSLDGAQPQRLTQGTGVEHSPKLAGGQLVYIGNDRGRMPNRRMIWSARGSPVVLTPSADENSRQGAVWRQFVDAEVVPVQAADGVVSQHLLMRPRGQPPRNGFPVIVSSKGGPDGRVSPGNGVYTALGQYAVSRGYLFVEINYRGGTGFGLAYRFPAGAGATGASEVKDLEALARYLRARPDVDARRIGIMGGSYGGHIVGLALTRLPEYFAAGAHLSGVSDWVMEMKLDQRDEGWASAPPEVIRLSERLQIEDLAYASSPPAHLAAWRAPTLFTMGELDRSGHMESIIDLGYRLIEQGTPVEFAIAPEAGHSGLRARPPQTVFEFFERTLRGR